MILYLLEIVNCCALKGLCVNRVTCQTIGLLDEQSYFIVSHRHNTRHNTRVRPFCLKKRTRVLSCVKRDALTTFVQTVRSWNLLPPLWPHNQPQTAVECTETAQPKSDRKHIDSSGKCWKQLKKIRKNTKPDLVRMRAPVQIRIAAPQKPLFSLEKGGFIFGGERTTSYTGGLPPYALAKSSESDKKVSNRR